MAVIIEYNNTEGHVRSRLTLDQLSVISQVCSFKVEGSEYKANAFRAKTNGQCQWDGYKRLFNTQTQKFPIGLLPRIMNLFNTVGIQVELVDRRTHMNRQFDLTCTPKEVREYQNSITFDSVINGNGIIKAATGSGKTTIAAMTMSAIGKPTVFIVHTKDLLYQAKDEFAKLLGCKIGQIGDGIVDPMNITVATVQTLSRAYENFYESYKYDEDGGEPDNKDITKDDKARILQWAKTVGVVQFDEVHRVCSRTAYAARFMFPMADNSYGYSASPWRDDGADLMIEAAFGPIISEISASELIRVGYLIRPTIEIKTISNNVWDGSTYEQIYKTAIVENVFRNMQVAQDAIRHYDDGRCTLILITQIKHGEKLQDMIRGMGRPAQFISGKSNMQYRKRTIADMKNGKAPLVIASTIADVGLDVPRLNAIVEAGAGKSSVTALQRLGRGMRRFDGKTDFIMTTYRDNVPFIYRHIDKKIEIWSTEPEFIIREV